MKHFSRHSILLALSLSVSLASAACTEPRPERDGCVSDVECKGDRVCGEAGQCVPIGGQPDQPDAGGEDTSDPEDTTEPGDTSDPKEDGGLEPSCAPPQISAAGMNNETSSVQALPGSTIQLDASANDQAGATYHWRFIEYPYSDSMAHLEPKLVTHANGTADFKAETLGAYTVELSLKDADGTALCAPSTAELLIKTEDQIYVELVWDTPAMADQNDGTGPDLELHYKHPNGNWAVYEPPLDIYWYTPTADWGLEGDTSDDPVMRRFVENGPGPEAIYHTNPAPKVYSVGIYTYDDYGHGPSFATVRVYLNGDLADEVARIEMEETNDFYEVLTIDAANNTTEYLDNYYEDFLEI